MKARVTESDRTDTQPRLGLVLALLMSGLAGMVDAIGLIRLKDLFVSFMSGNTTQFAIAVGRGRFDEAGQILTLIALFVVGAAGGQLLAHVAASRHLTAVLAAVAALLTVAALFDTAPLPMVLAMGAMNAAMHRAGNVSVSLTFVTGTLVRFGQGLGNFIATGPNGWSWVEQTVPWLGIAAGAILAAAVHMRIGSAVDWLPVTLAGALCLASLVIPAPD